MATYNIQMQKYNGTDYDLIYPKCNLANVTGVLPIANGGTGASSLAEAKTALGITGTAAACSYTTTVTSGSTALLTSGGAYTFFHNGGAL